jgi:hypothetical protein
VILKTPANTPKALEIKMRVMRHSYLRLCVLDAVFFAAEQFFAGTFGPILPSTTASVPAFKPPGSALEIQRSKSP